MKPDMRAIGEQDFKESSFAAGVEHERKKAIEAAKKMIDTFYESGFDPTIDYLDIFTKEL